MENGKADNNNPANQGENPTNNTVINDISTNANNNDEGRAAGGGSRRRTPFTTLSQEEADLALARTLQEQERAYMMLRMNVGDGSDYGSWETGSYGHGDEDDDDFDDHSEEELEGSELEEDDNEEEEDAFDVNARAEEDADDNQNVEIDPSAYSSDEAYARALQEAEEREMAARLLAMAGISEMVVGDEDDDDEEDPEEDLGGDSQVGETLRDAWEEVDPDELSYEELIALGEVVGTESRGLSADTIASLPSVNYKAQPGQDGICDSCVICRLDYDEGDALTVLSCKHNYHSECLNNWLRINKICPVCSAEVSTSGSS
ncbi:OLC1v1033283C1 [Oldenlandia corymbosa var. corymbosa]|uniref:OLC1v1033283C1 n=1 Tax=Oldenlandia corymbosa var. corymbosa TaxID=529605 RepID=A0AAV1CPF5_OLDCO|nr:OLC1v1033283C1 [Oldenlandia corymbosa var. corymbosa]